MFGRRTAVGNQPMSASQSDSCDDRRLIEHIADGDLRAFERLYRSYHPRLTRFLSNFSRRPQLVEEVLNDTLLVVWSRPETYNGSCQPSTWIFAIAYRKALKALRRHDEPIDDPKADTRASLEAGPEQLLGQRQVQERLMRAVQGLSPDHRAVVDLTYFHGVGYREIAQIMGCPVDTVKSRMFHARRRLKSVLAGQLEDWL